MTAESDADECRELSNRGIREVEDVVRLRRDDLIDVKQIYSSPHIRVKQTLEIARKMLDSHATITESQYLTTGSRLDEIVSFVGELDLDGGDTLLSSHQSCTSILVLWLTGVDVLIPNGSLLAIAVDKPEQGGGTILWQESRDGGQIKRATDFVDQF